MYIEQLQNNKTEVDHLKDACSGNNNFKDEILQLEARLNADFDFICDTKRPLVWPEVPL